MMAKSQLNLIEILWRFMKYYWLPFSAYASFQCLSEAVEEILTHKFGKSFGFFIVLWIELGLLADLTVARPHGLVGLPVLLVEDRALLNIDAIARLIGANELGVVSDLSF